LDPRALDASAKGVPKDGIAIAEEIRGAVSSGKVSTICWAVHAAVGCSVTLKWRTRRRWWARTTRTKSTRQRAVGTVKKSIETRPWTWYVRKARQV
jgi:hypothetical protein